MTKIGYSVLLLGVVLCGAMTEAQPLLGGDPGSAEQICKMLETVPDESGLLKLLCDALKQLPVVGPTIPDKPKPKGLFLARRYDLLYGDITSDGVPSMDPLSYPSGDTQWSIAIDYDPVDDYVYWSTQSKIHRAKRSGSDVEELHDGLGAEVDGMAIDSVARLLYWTDASEDTLSVSDLEGKYTKTIFKNMHNPRAIVLDPEEGMMYWTEWGARPRIAKSSLNGENVETIVDSDVVWPNGLALDKERRVLYFADASLDKVEEVGLDGSGRKLLSDSAANHIYAVSYLDNYLYYTDWTSQKVMRMLVTSPSKTEDVYTSTTRPMAVKATELAPSDETNACAGGNGGCSHFCFYTPSGVECGCPDGMEVEDDGKTCGTPGSGVPTGKGLFVARRTDLLYGAITSTGVPTMDPLPYPSGDTQWSIAIDYDPVDDYVYWSQQNKIHRAKRDGSDLKELHDGLGAEVDGMAIDWVARNLYWTDASQDTLSVSDLDGTYTKTIFRNMYNPRAIVLDPEEGMMYWTEWGTQPRIAKSSLNGENVQTIVNTEVVWPNGLALDKERRVLYFADASLDKVEEVGLDGSGRRLLSDSAANHIYAVSYLDNYLYYTDWTTERVMRMLVTSPSKTEILYTSSTRPMAVKASEMKASDVTNGCSMGNGGCSHFCFFTQTGVECGCPDGMQLQDGGKTCGTPVPVVTGDKGLFVARRYDLLFGSITSAGVSDMEKLPYAASSTQLAIAIDYDPVDKHVYWSRQSMIYRAKQDGSDLKVLHTGLGLEVDGMAVDWVGRNLYWTDASKDTLSVSDLDGTYTKTVFKNMHNPRAIVVDPEEGMMYWTEWGDKPRIAKSSLDGENVQTIVDSGVVWPNGLALDKERRVLYFADASTDKVEEVGLDGSGRKLLSASAANHIYAVSYLDNYLYYTDWSSQRVMRFSVTSPSSTEVLYTSTTRPMAVKATRMSPSSETNSCSVNNGGCSDFCFYTPTGVKCGCADGDILIGGSICI